MRRRGKRVEVAKEIPKEEIVVVAEDLNEEELVRLLIFEIENNQMTGNL